MKRNIRYLLNSFLFILIAAADSVYAQASSDDEMLKNNISSSPSMATGFYADGKIWVVIGVIAIILTGLILYLVRIDRKINKLEKELESK